jgi:molybdopterin-containing oxidoreductase family membrane subunit
VPGWHSTIFAPYFVAGAIFSGSAMVLTLLILFRKAFKLEAYITNRHFENLAKVVLLTSLIVTYSYLTEYFIVHYNQNAVEHAGFLFRAGGHYAPLFWIMLTCNSGIPLLLFFPGVRKSVPALFIISLAINLGMWLERFVIIVTSLAHEFMPYAWGNYHPTWVDYSLTLGSFGWFFFLFLSFVRLFPAVSLTEVKEHLPHPGGPEP